MTQGINSLNEIGLEFDGVVTMNYLCPRCGGKNRTTIHARHLADMIELYCGNPACGSGNFWLFMTVDVKGGYKDTSDIMMRTPLATDGITA